MDETIPRMNVTPRQRDPGGGREIVWQTVTVSALLFMAAGVPPSGSSWRGTVTVDGMIYEPGGYHPYAATITLHLREGERSAVPGGYRVALVSEGSTNDVRTSVHQESGLMLCSGTGTETLPGRAMGYLETKAGRTTYHLAVPRAFGAFACGRNRAIKRDRVITIGDGDPEPAEIETSDSVLRTLEGANALMEGSFASTKTRGAIRYEYKISWSLDREQSSVGALTAR
jgi:hypothetical protein